MKLNHNYHKISCFFKRKFKQQNKICDISKSDLWFFTIKYVQLFFLFPKKCLRMKFFSQEVLSLSSPRSHHHNSKPTRIQHSNLQCSMINSYSKCLVCPKPSTLDFPWISLKARCFRTSRTSHQIYPSKCTLPLGFSGSSKYQASS